MTIDEAIAVLDRHYILHYNVPPDDLLNAAELGIEALKRLRELREVGSMSSGPLLPGETEK